MVRVTNVGTVLQWYWGVFHAPAASNRRHPTPANTRQHSSTNHHATYQCHQAAKPTDAIVAPVCTAPHTRHGTARHGTARHRTAPHLLRSCRTPSPRRSQRSSGGRRRAKGARTRRYRCATFMPPPAYLLSLSITFMQPLVYLIWFVESSVLMCRLTPLCHALL